MRDSHRAPEDPHARLEYMVGSGLGEDEDWYAAGNQQRDAYRRRALILAASVAAIAIAVGGYSIGSSQGIDVGAVERAGIAAGQQRGTALGTREGFASTFKDAREDAYAAAYRRAYKAAYRDEFDEAGLAAPSHVLVKGP